ncbi:putative S-adenosylmethionine synthetase, partial [Streptococcus mutans 11VS1]
MRIARKVFNFQSVLCNSLQMTASKVASHLTVAAIGGLPQRLTSLTLERERFLVFSRLVGRKFLFFRETSIFKGGHFMSERK